MYVYRIFGFLVNSEFEIAELNTVTPEEAVAPSNPVLEVVYGKVPETLPGSFKIANWIEATKTDALFNIRGTIRLLASAGRRIVIDVESRCSPTVVRDYIIGCGFPTIAHQRKLVPLHVSMIDTPYGVWMFAGASGAGKSTTSATLAQERGWTLLCDDLTVLNTEDQGSFYFGINKIKLWDDAVQKLGFDISTLQKDSFREHKYHVNTPLQGPVKAGKLVGIVSLQWAEDNANILALSRPYIFKSLMNSIYAPDFVSVFNNLEQIQCNLLNLSRVISGYSHVGTKISNRMDEIKLTISQHSIKKQT